MKLTPEQLHILQHSLGCDKYGQTTYRRGPDEGDVCSIYSRNRYVSDPSLDLEALCLMGCLADRGPIGVYGEMHYYVVSREGMKAMRAQSPRPPKLSASQRRYREWLNADCGMAFGEWLKARKVATV